MPTRLLYVGSDNEASRLRLDALPPIQPYVALSHCWGDRSAIFTTTKVTLASTLVNIPWEKLPKTFQDAISITRALEIQYLWIDSMCIIQDDPLDWKAESVKMAEIYAGPYLTLSATGASSPTSGCLFTRHHETKFGAIVSHVDSNSYSDRASTDNSIQSRYCSRAHTQFVGRLLPPMAGAPLWNRAWAFQERVLSNRLIHFHGEEMIWECREHTDCECGYLGWEHSPSAMYVQGGPTLSAENIVAGANVDSDASLTVFSKWLEIVHTFTKLNITYELDRLPAISGMANAICERLESSYTAGVWQYRLGQGLLWRKEPFQTSRRVQSTLVQYVPSWSWASVQLLSHRSVGLHMYTTNITIEKDFQYTGPRLSKREVKSIIGHQEASLRISGLAISCTLTHRHGAISDTDATHFLIFRGETVPVYTDITCTSSTPQENPEVVCLLVGVSNAEPPMEFSSDGTDYKNLSQSIYRYALVLQVLSTGMYTRVGLSEHYRDMGWFDNAEVREVVII